MKLPEDLKSFRADRISVMQRTIDALCIALAVALMAAGVFLALALERVS